ncbi:nuclear transport factor 2 family protein [Rhodococcus pyridinivorans]|uniref:nuclear transport factor 2 family protein n=1 Tax=Rhodococcus pyridinivorans TaxID=103816 RepID=UPI0022836F6F|nr:nuclear transport factor 2 family protein [Rhodococcus pyridinivorans]WAL44375.1 hypothetical protein OQN32_12595 [Rhodococcus pyridinivorans]
MARGNRAAFDEVIGVGGFTRERKTAPPSARGTGPDAFYELALWLRAAFEDLRYEIHHAVTERNLVTVNSTIRVTPLGATARLRSRRSHLDGVSVDPPRRQGSPLQM